MLKFSSFKAKCIVHIFMAKMSDKYLTDYLYFKAITLSLFSNELRFHYCFVVGNIKILT